ncbi:tRNA (N6-isopentenyl adenosine(37)-C2)-methylthiotransferase MiaB [Tepidibacter formicigenes]|uniref:tRNA-2-methylthio-N(6)-dimethylallyladenosine synthase n=1 Tax=Tepidibacter formicigenes DSM 15518 TaxID=1123349 RepID=A0A1M6M5P3_9FIRM|nr:tRNA (N6-isopentenyl adenosine(37)-C2)-methylthiotransferase MiaB [Tepidibacter formicigenes]SHJ78747.1 tRNA-2-methylthio-N6-dimethylallyladenosine synthase [Tepidibacter formicigenes DSM 15518]
MGKRKQIHVPIEKIREQDKYIEMIKCQNDRYFEMTGKRKKHLTVTYGCQMNEHDSEKLDAMLSKMGYEKAKDAEEADLIIYNTCAVRENAELKVYGNLGHLKTIKQKNPNLIIAVCGCMMQQPHVVEEIKKKYNHVNLVFGTHNLYKFGELLYESLQSGEILIDVWDVDGEVVEGLESNRKYELKAFVNVAYGCNNFCTYCIVPYTRGRERSRKPEDIINEVKDLAKNGTKEITLLGQNVNSYGNTFDTDYSFSDLLRDLDKIEGIERIRFMTSHPKDLSDDLIYAMRDCKKVCEFLHLPVQAGSTKVLKKMNRKYTKESYLDLVEKIKKEIPDIALSTDIMIGFPGETEEDFLDTLDVVQKVRYDSAFTFIYSIRKGTPAAKMENQIPDDIKHDRFNRLLEVVNTISKEKNMRYKDKVVEVLVEGESKTDSTKLTGRTRQNKLVNFEGSKDLIGKLVDVKITEVKTFSLNGIVVNK